MSEPKFTPGPWSIEPHGNALTLYSGRSNQRHGLNLMRLDEGDRNMEANNALIASAPDLYDVAEKMLARFELYAGVDDMHAGHHDKALLDQARVTLAKARGEA